MSSRALDRLREAAAALALPGRPHALSGRDVEDLKALLEDRDAHIADQYGEIARLLQAQERGLAGKLLYLAKRAYVRYRR